MKSIPFSAHVMLFLHKFLFTAILLAVGANALGNYLAQIDFYAVFMLDENSPVAEGLITERWIQDWDLHGYPTLYGYEYSFYSPAGEHIRWDSYSPREDLKAGDKIKIRYNADVPRINRAIGMTNSPKKFPFFWGFLPLVSALIALYVSRYFQVLNILFNRRITYGTLVKREKMAFQINGKHAYKMYFQFITVSGKKVTAHIKTTNVHELQDEHRELLAYHRNNPKRIVMADTLYGAARNFLYDEYEKESKQKV